MYISVINTIAPFLIDVQMLTLFQKYEFADCIRGYQANGAPHLAIGPNVQI